MIMTLVWLIEKSKNNGNGSVQVSTAILEQLLEQALEKSDSKDPPSPPKASGD